MCSMICCHSFYYLVTIMHVINRYFFLHIVSMIFGFYELYRFLSSADAVLNPLNSLYPNTPQNITQLISFEEDGRLGNLLMETATLLLVAEKFNISAKILPQMSGKIAHLLCNLPVS